MPVLWQHPAESRTCRYSREREGEKEREREREREGERERERREILQADPSS